MRQTTLRYDTRSPSQKRRDLLKEQKRPENYDEDEFFSFKEFDKDIEYTTRAALLYRFYEWNNFDDGMKAWNTSSFILDPPHFTPPGSHSWWILHFQEFHVQIQHSYHSPQSVHRARLFYRQNATGQTLWLAACQVGPAYFFSQADMATAYMTCLIKKEFYMTEKEAKQIVAR